jgi:NAD+ kinase
MYVGIVAQKGNPRARSLATAIGRNLREDAVEVAVDTVTAAALSDEERSSYGGKSRDTPDFEAIDVDALDRCDLVVSIGGDGTFLFAARGVGDTPIVGVNLGEVGFLNAVAPADAVGVVESVVADLRADGETPTRTMPRVRAHGEEWTLPPALNEVVVQGPQRGHGNGLGVTVRVDGSLYTSGQADGVLVATPTGSTAYNLSESGPLVHPDVRAMVVTEMAAEREMPPLVVDEGSEITIRVENAETASVVSDGRVTETVEPPAQFGVTLAADPVRVAGPPLDFFTALEKLS